MKSIWERIKLALNRKPEGDILLPPVEVKPTVPEQPKPKRTRKKPDAKV